LGVGSRATGISPTLALPGQTRITIGKGERCRRTGLVVRAGGREDGGGGLRCPADVAIMQTVDFGHLQDPSRFGELDRSEVGCVLVEREMGARLMVIVVEIKGADNRPLWCLR
jgi:hypothetical protein